MYNNLIFLTNPVNGAQLLMQLTLWTFSVNSLSRDSKLPRPFYLNNVAKLVISDKF